LFKETINLRVHEFGENKRSSVKVYSKFRRWRQSAGLLLVDAYATALYAMTTDPIGYIAGLSNEN